MRRRTEWGGHVLIDRVVVDGEAYWHASFRKDEPPRNVGHWADKVLVETISRAGKSRETCEAKARELVEAMGYPDAEFHYSSNVPESEVASAPGP